MLQCCQRIRKAPARTVAITGAPSPMQRYEGKVAIVTGASSGIGAAIAKSLVKRGLLVVGLARRTERLEELAKQVANEPGKFYSYRCDVKKEDDIKNAYRWVKTHVGLVHVLINNAGLTKNSNLSEGATEDWREIMEVNVIGLCVCAREAVKVMREHNIQGHIVNINSITGHIPVNLPIPVLNVYPASKYAVTALTETLQQEMRYFGTKIRVSSVSPGLVKTEWSEGLGETIKGALGTPGVPILESKDIAEAVIYVLSTDPNVQVTELTIRPLGEQY